MSNIHSQLGMNDGPKVGNVKCSLGSVYVSWNLDQALCWSAPDAITKHYRLDGLNNRN
jgi:hypothetical protein